MDGKVVEQKGRMTAVAVEIRKKESGQLVAIGRQWMTASRPKGSQNTGHWTVASGREGSQSKM